ncbi:hypothetical protein CHLNCDRAFT_51546 [Chlorella variabilis]|uniref:Transcription initiation factor IIE subunit alpha N-terminal domain-containing protein n=1 Tax=Chlorella variabilis TaxID=554065 RepID=E1ZC94_CHLVA|nr:hypothetical protein CHLNCDRAFT_51546 [Chlorella variabilis]EFN56571.1 hypothetical protein CHLNCDRAFT_51546 [Chlorella variabilis]|eukprot:XP_005848673.1 hypothetical protein CHLNCDRAFT_51546 [Chlorella variabilis]
MSAAAGGGRSLGGDAGYKRLVRLLGRAFYSGECPPREAEEEVPAGARSTRRDKNEYIGLGVLLLDLLAAAHGYVKDVAITGQLGVSGKVANRALRYLQSEGLLSSEVTKTKVRRQNVEQPDDSELEARMSQMTNTWWCVAYPALMDSLQLRLHRMREVLKKHMGHGEDVAEYLCRRCGATYTSLDAVRLLDHATGAFLCEECHAELDANIEAAGLGGSSGAASRQQLQQYAKRMLEKMETQLRPILDQLEKLKDVPPPDFGSLREDLDDDQVLDWLARAEVDVQLGGEGAAAAAAAAGPGKELPAWFRGAAESESVGLVASQEGPGGEAEQQQQQQGDADEQKRLQEAFLAQYLAQVNATAQRVQEDGDGKLTPDAKRIKTEDGYAGVKAEEAAGGEEWEDVKMEQPEGVKAEQQQQQQPLQQEQPPDGGAAADEDEEVLSLATKAPQQAALSICSRALSLPQYCKKCNAVQFERKASKNRSTGGEEEGKRIPKRKSADSSGSEEDMEEDESEVEEEAARQGGQTTAAAAAAAPRFDTGFTNIPQATSYAIQQEEELCDQEPFDCADGPDRPMLELQAGSRVYFQASIIRESKTEIRVLFPETKQMAERREWVDKRSSRIWRGRMESRYWRYIKGLDGGWEPKNVPESTLGGSFKRKGSGRSRGSRSRGTKHSTEEGTESEQRKAAAAALDTAASPKPKAVKKQHSGRRRQPPRDAVDAEGSSGGGSEAGQASGNSDAKRQGSGAGVGSSERRQQVGRGGGAPVAGGDPLEAWFKQHYALLKAADLLGAGFLPASAETGWPWGNGRRRRGGQQPRRAKPEAAAAAQRSREQRREERQVARQQAQSSEAESSEDEGPAAAAPGSAGAAPRGRGAKGGRELKRLQMWAWERRGRSDSGTSDEDEDDEDASGTMGLLSLAEAFLLRETTALLQWPEDDSGSKDSEEKGSKSGAQQQAAQQPQAQQHPKAKDKAPAAKRAPEAAQPKQPAAEPGTLSPQSGGKAAEPRAAPGSTGEAKQARGKQQQLPAAPQPAAVEKTQPKPRPPPKPLAVLEECDVFGKLPPVKRQPSGVLLPTSPRAAAAAAPAAAGGAIKPGPAAAGSQLQLPKQPSDASAKAPSAVSPADKQAAALSAPEQQQQQRAVNGGDAAAPTLVAAAGACKPALSPLKRKMLERCAPGGEEALLAAGAPPPGEQQQQQQQQGGAEPPAKRHAVEAGDGSAQLPGAAHAAPGRSPSPRKRLLQVAAPMET